MKRFFVFAFVVAFSFVAAMPVLAAEFKAKGEYKFSFLGLWDTDFYPKSVNHKDEDNFQARQRVRVQVDAIVSENLKGVLQFEIGENQWGYTRTGSAIGADGTNVKTKHAYIAFNIPQTDLLFQFGIMGVAMPAAVAGSPILDDEVAAILARHKLNDMMSVVVAWARLYDLEQNDISLPSSASNDEFDAWALIVPVTGDGWSVTPWALVASVGRDTIYNIATGRDRICGQSVPGNASDRLDGLLSPAARTGLSRVPLLAYNTYLRKQSELFAWLAGAAIEVNLLDPVAFKLDFTYGSVDAASSVLDRKGWYLAAAVDYKFDFMTASLYGWYASGEDGSWKNGSEQMPLIQSGFGASSFVFDGSQLLEGGGLLSNRHSVEGKWAIALALKDITFTQDLSHTLRFVYSCGTNAPSSRRITGILGDPSITLGYRSGMPYPTYMYSGWQVENVTLTTEDSLVEINFDHKYMLYENLAAILELGYAHLNINNNTYISDDTTDAWKVGFGLKYTF